MGVTAPRSPALERTAILSRALAGHPVQQIHPNASRKPEPLLCLAVRRAGAVRVSDSFIGVFLPHLVRVQVSIGRESRAG